MEMEFKDESNKDEKEEAIFDQDDDDDISIIEGSNIRCIEGVINEDDITLSIFKYITKV